MALPVMVEDQESLPEGYADLYTETDSGYVLDIEGVDSHPTVTGLKTAYSKEKEKRQQLAKQRDQYKTRAEMIPDDMEPDTVKSVIERLQAGEDPFKSDDKDKPDPAKIKAEIEKRYQAQLDELTQGLSKKDAQVRQLVIDNGLTAALVKNKVVNPSFQKAAKKLLADQIQIKEGEDGSIAATVETDLGEIGLDQFVHNWTEGEEGRYFVEGNTGSGAPGSKGGPKGKKEIKRSQFDALDHGEKAEFLKSGGKITD